MSRTRILLADDSPDFLEIVKNLLSPVFEIVGEVSDGKAVIEEARRLEPEVLVLDITMPIVDGIEAAERLKKLGNKSKIVFLTVHNDPDYLRACMAAGASGYVLKARLVTDLVHSIEESLMGHIFVSPR